MPILKAVRPKYYLVWVASALFTITQGLPLARAQVDETASSEDESVVGVEGEELAPTVVIGDSMWSTAINREYTNWRLASRYCRSQTWGGYDNWRLPTLFELESLYEADAASTFKIREPFELDSCCAWSSTSLEHLEAPEMDALLDEPWQYAWGLMFNTGVRYYSGRHQPDGQAICVRDILEPTADE